MKLRYKLALGGFVGLLVFLAAVAWLIQWSGQRALDHEIELVIAAGGARDFSAFAELDIPDDQNAALAWLAAAAELERINALSPPGREQELQDEILGGSWNEAEPDTLRRLIEERQSVVEMAWDAAELTAVRWPLDYHAEAYMLEIGYFPSCRGLARLLVAHAHLALATENSRRADRSFAAALSLSEDVVEFPVLLSALLGFGIDGFVIDQLESDQVFSTGELPKTLEVLESRDYRAWVSRALLGEVAFALSYDWADEVAELVGEFRVSVSRPWRSHDMALYIRNLREVSELSQRPSYEIAAEIQRIEEYTYPWVYPIAEHIGHPYERIFRNYVAQQELRRYQLIWAAQLAGGQTAIDPPVDVLTGQPLKSWQTPDGGWVLWSVEAEKPDSDLMKREYAVWRTSPGPLPPELQPFAHELNEEEDGY